MRMTVADRPVSEEDWHRLLRKRTFGEIIGWQETGAPVVTPVHFMFTQAETVEFHLHKENPLWEPLRRTGAAMLSVTDADAYIPSLWNAKPGRDPAWATPTSYYAAVQLEGAVEIIDDPQDLAAVLNRQLRHFQPEGGYHVVHPGSNPFGKMLSAISGGRLYPEKIRAKFKFGGRDPEQARQIAENLRERGAAADLRAREHMIRRLGDTQKKN